MCQKMAGIILKQEMELSSLRPLDTFILHISAEKEGILPILVGQAEQWRQKQKAGVMKQPLRVFLCRQCSRS